MPKPKVGDLVELRKAIYKDESLVLVVEIGLRGRFGDIRPHHFLALTVGTDHENIYHFEDIEYIVSGEE